jgi:hypothetical protein
MSFDSTVFQPSLSQTVTRFGPQHTTKNSRHRPDIRRSLTTAYHPESDGQVERYNRVIQEVLRHFVTPRATNWDKLLPTGRVCSQYPQTRVDLGIRPSSSTLAEIRAHPLIGSSMRFARERSITGPLTSVPRLRSSHNQWEETLERRQRSHLQGSEPPKGLCRLQKSGSARKA